MNTQKNGAANLGRRKPSKKSQEAEGVGVGVACEEAPFYCLAGAMISSDTERIKVLEEKLAEVTRHRDALEKDVESLCMQNGEFSGSEVLGHRIRSLEQKLKKTEQSTGKVTADRDGLREDIKQQKLAKKSLDEALKGEIEKNKQLEKELHHYYCSSGSIIAERDKAMLESERAVKEAAAARRELSSLQAEATTQESKLSEALKHSDVLEQRCVKLAAQAALSAKVEPLQEELKSTQRKLEEVASERDGLAKERDDFRGEVDSLSAELASTSAAGKEEIDGLTRTKESLEERIGQLEGMLENVVEEKAKLSNELENQKSIKKTMSSNLEKSQVKFETVERLTKLFVDEYRNQRNRIDQKLAEASTSEIESIATQEFGFDLERIREIASPFDEIPQLISEWADLLKDVLCTHVQEKAAQCIYKNNANNFKQKLAQATAEKVQAMMANAELQVKR